jgi:hypothetical protein
MLNQIKTLELTVLTKVTHINDEETLIQYRNDILGKAGELTTILK